MKGLNLFTELEAKHIAINILGKTYSSFEYFAFDDSVKIYLYDSDKSESSNWRCHVRIHGDGKVVKMMLMGQPKCPAYVPINGLPVIDYLREEGFEFKYSIPLTT